MSGRPQQPRLPSTALAAASTVAAGVDKTTSSADVSIVVPTYRRPEQLRLCLEGLVQQRIPARDVVVVRRAADEETASVLRAWEGEVTEVTVTGAGVVTAMAAGVRATAGEIVAFTDDDAVPRPDWIARICSHFGDPLVGGVGGRDVIHPPDRRATDRKYDVGQISAWGKVTGNHHLGVGSAREVMVLKGTNMAFRRAALALPRGLRGSGAEVHHEVAICLWARKRGWRLIYDPELVVDHFPGPRFDADRRGRPDELAMRDASYNLVASLLALEPRLFLRRASYGLLVGDAGSPGLARASLAVVRGERAVLRRLVPSLAGQSRALADFALERRVEMVPAQ
jgi:GT2 family glycosyltransferase